MDPNIGGQAKNLPPKPSFPRPRSQDLPLQAETVNLETAHRTRPRNLKEHPSYPPKQHDGRGSGPSVAAVATTPKFGLDEIREEEEALKAHHRSQGKMEEELRERLEQSIFEAIEV